MKKPVTRAPSHKRVLCLAGAVVESRPMDKSLKPPKGLLRPIGRAIADYGMIRNGDRVLLGLSGKG